MRIADAEGFAAVSMRRIATELDAGTMTLYHYVRTKDELLTLVVDAVMGEVVIPATEPIPTDWRAALTMVAERTRAALERHPWILDITDDPAVGPNSVRHFDQSLQAVASLNLPLTDKLRHRERGRRVRVRLLPAAPQQPGSRPSRRSTTT